MKQIGERQAQATVSAVPAVSLSRGVAQPLSRGVAQPGTISGDLIAQLRMLEEMKSAISGLQAQIAVAFDLAQRAEQAEAGVPAAERGKGVGAQVALARRESPNRGSRLLGLAKALVTEMPRTLAALNKGLLNEWRATLLVKETACLSVEDRAAVDAELAPDTGTFDGAGDKAIIAAAKAAAYRRDPRSVAQRASHAATERTVSLRPAPDTMTYLTALLPVGQGVAVYAALTRSADSARSSGDPRTRGQVMADTLVERTTGTPGGISGVELQVVMTDRTLFQSDSEPARLHGYGIVPAPWARTLIGAATHPEQPVQPTSYDHGGRRHQHQPQTARQATDHRRASGQHPVRTGNQHEVPPHRTYSRHPSRTRSSRSGSGGSTPRPKAVSCWPWTPKPGSSRTGTDDSSKPATIPAGHRTATRPSGTSITSYRGTPAGPPPWTTQQGSAKHATTPKKTPAGPPHPYPKTPTP